MGEREENLGNIVKTQRNQLDSLRIFILHNILVKIIFVLINKIFY